MRFWKPPAAKRQRTKNESEIMSPFRTALRRSYNMNFNRARAIISPTQNDQFISGITHSNKGGFVCHLRDFRHTFFLSRIEATTNTWLMLRITHPARRGSLGRIGHGAAAASSSTSRQQHRSSHAETTTQKLQTQPPNNRLRTLWEKSFKIVPKPA